MNDNLFFIRIRSSNILNTNKLQVIEQLKPFPNGSPTVAKPAKSTLLGCAFRRIGRLAGTNRANWERLGELRLQFVRIELSHAHAPLCQYLPIQPAKPPPDAKSAIRSKRYRSRRPSPPDSKRRASDEPGAVQCDGNSHRREVSGHGRARPREFTHEGLLRRLDAAADA